MANNRFNKKGQYRFLEWDCFAYNFILDRKFGTLQ